MTLDIGFSKKSKAATLEIDRGEQESPISENMLFDHAARSAAWSTSLSERYISENMLFDFTGR